MNKEVKELIEQLEEYASGGVSGLYPFEESVKALLDYINQLETNIDELKKWLEEFQEDYCYDTDVEYFCKDENVEIKVQDVLDKMQELERGKE